MAITEVSLVDNSKQIIDAAQEQVIKALEEIGLLAEGYAKVNITEQKAVDTGNLRNSISHKVVADDRSVYIGTNVEYAPYIEFGTGIYAEQGGRQTPWAYQDTEGNWHKTKGQKARPYLRPAASDHSEEYMQVLEDNLKSEQ